MIHRIYKMRMFDPSTVIIVNEWDFEKKFGTENDALNFERFMLRYNEAYNKANVLHIEMYDYEDKA